MKENPAPSRPSHTAPDKPEGYDRLLADLRSLLDRGLSRAYQAVDNIRVQTYWQIGERIVREELHHQKPSYGRQVVPFLAKDTGLSQALLYDILQFHQTYPILQTVSVKLSWSHFVELSAIENMQERRYYEQSALTGSWSVVLRLVRVGGLTALSYGDFSLLNPNA